MLISDIFSSKIFKFHFSVNIESQECFLFLYFYELPLPKFSTRICKLLQSLMVHFYHIDMSGNIIHIHNMYKDKNNNVYSFQTYMELIK